jgi:hypothetical protein
MTQIHFFSSTVGELARLTISITRNFDSDNPFTVRFGNDTEWPLAVKDAARLAACGARIEGALDLAAQHNSPVRLEPFFQRQLGFGDGSAAKIEIGLDELNGQAAPYLEWNNKRAIDRSGRLLKALSTIGEATQTVRQAEASRRTQNLQVDLRNFRSPIGWDGRAPYDP